MLRNGTVPVGYDGGLCSVECTPPSQKPSRNPQKILPKTHGAVHQLANDSLPDVRACVRACLPSLRKNNNQPAGSERCPSYSYLVQKQGIL